MTNSCKWMLQSYKRKYYTIMNNLKSISKNIKVKVASHDEVGFAKITGLLVMHAASCVASALHAAHAAKPMNQRSQLSHPF